MQADRVNVDRGICIPLADGTHTTLKTELRLSRARRPNHFNNATARKTPPQCFVKGTQSCGQKAGLGLLQADAFLDGPWLWAYAQGDLGKEVITGRSMQSERADELMGVFGHHILHRDKQSHFENCEESREDAGAPCGAVTPF